VPPADQAEEAPVAGAEIEEAVDAFGKRLQQQVLCKRAVGDLAREVLGDPLGIRPLIDIAVRLRDGSRIRPACGCSVAGVLGSKA
jgi:hypothetical protein